MPGSLCTVPAWPLLRVSGLRRQTWAIGRLRSEEASRLMRPGEPIKLYIANSLTVMTCSLCQQPRTQCNMQIPSVQIGTAPLPIPPPTLICSLRNIDCIERVERGSIMLLLLPMDRCSTC
eukprot:364800-Chlamydomonas_euryale.AAC.8